MGFSLKSVGNLVGLSFGGAGDKFRPSGVLDIEGTKASASEALRLIQELLKAGGMGGGKFLEDTFGEEIMNFLVPFRAQTRSNRERAKEAFLRSGTGSPELMAEILRRVDRDSGSQLSRGIRQIGIGQARRREEFPFKALGISTPFISRQQQFAMRENEFGQQFNRERERYKEAQKMGNMGTLRRIASYGFGGGGVDPLSDPSGFMSNVRPPSSTSRGGGDFDDYLDTIQDEEGIFDYNPGGY
jgi:hypothetical protein